MSETTPETPTRYTWTTNMATPTVRTRNAYGCQVAADDAQPGVRVVVCSGQVGNATWQFKRVVTDPVEANADAGADVAAYVFAQLSAQIGWSIVGHAAMVDLAAKDKAAAVEAKAAAPAAEG